MKLRQSIIILAFIFLLAVIFISLASSLYRGKNVFREQLVESLERQAKTSQLLHDLGYGGFIHNFKNFVLRGEEIYYQKALANLENFERGVSSELSEEERADLVPVIKMLANYKISLEKAHRLWAQGADPEHIDRAVQVNDTAAAEAINRVVTQQKQVNQDLSGQASDFENSVNKMLWLALSLSTLAGIALCIAGWYMVRLHAQSRDNLARLEAKDKLLDSAPNALMVVADDGEVVVANKGAETLFEMGRDELIGCKIEDFMPGAFREQHTQFRSNFFETKGARTMLNPVPLHLKSGLVKQVEVYIGLYQVNQRKFAVTNMLEVSNLKRLQKRAEKLEKTYKTTFEMAPIGIAHIAVDGRFITVNKQFEALFGFSRYELELMNFQDLRGNESGQDDLLHKIIDTHTETCRFEKNFWHKNGEKIWVNVVSTLCHNAASEPDHAIVIVEDISRRKHSEAELLSSEQRFKTIANHVNGVVWMSTPGAEKFLFVNDRYKGLWGRSVEALYKDPSGFWDAIVPEDRPRVLQSLSEHRQGKWDIDYRIRRPSGRVRYIHDEGSAVRGEKGELQYMVCLAQDITDEQHYKQRLRATNLQLERLAKFDPLTMTVRRQYATADLEECVALYRRYKTDASLIFIDIDDFKQVNDNYGHDVGDQVLIQFCRCVRENIRETDDFYRYAGDEFLILLRETNIGEAAHFIEKLEKICPALELEGAERINIGFSSGAASLATSQVEDSDQWVSCADEQMYLYKKQRKIDQFKAG